MGTTEKSRGRRSHNALQRAKKSLRTCDKFRVRPGQQLTSSQILCHFHPRPVVVTYPKRHFDAEHLEELSKIGRPSRADRAGSHGILKGQIPSDDPGKEFAQSGVGIGVSGTGKWNHGGELGVAESRECASKA